MNTRKAAIGLIFGAAFLLLAVRQDARANTVNFTETFSGSFTDALFSFDGINLASQLIAAGEDKPGGKFTEEEVTEGKPDGNSCTVPGGVPNAATEFTLVGAAGVRRFQPSGDLLYYRVTSSTTCTDFSSGTPPFPFVASGSAVFTGGTGKYTGATGSYSASSSGVILSLPGGVSGAGPGFGVLGSGSGSSTGTLNTP
jgi:hypothetical protein